LVTFGDEQSAVAALEMDGTTLEGGIVLRVSRADYSLGKDKSQDNGGKREEIWRRLPKSTQAGTLPVLLIWNVYNILGENRSEKFFEVQEREVRFASRHCRFLTKKL